jgi:CBS domain-containing protein
MMFLQGKRLVLNRPMAEKAYTIGSRAVASCVESQPISSVIGQLLEGYRKLPVTGSSGKLVGMVTISDILSYLGAGEKRRFFRRLNAPVRIIMESPVFIGKGTGTEKCIRLFQKHGRGSYPVVENGRLCGIVSEWDVAKNISGKTGLKVGDIMSSRPLKIGPDTNILDASKAMVGCFRRLPVVDSGRLLGILTPSDVLRHLHRNGHEQLKTGKIKAKDIMEKRVVVVRPSTSVGRLLAAMKNRGIGGFPVRENKKLVGMVTERDLVEHL